MTNRSDLVTWLRTTGGRTAAVILARPHIAQEYAELVRTNSPARLLYYTHDLHHVRLLRRFTTTWDWRALRQGRQIRGLEARIFRTVDGVVTPSIAEVPVIKRLAPSAEVTVVPPHLIGQGPPHPSALALRDREAVVMVGGFKHLPNVDAARYLVRDVMPIVWKSIPWARVMLVGGDAPAEITALAEDRVEILGYVADLGDVYARARMSVSPIRYGAGFKGKILSSLEAGIPVVTTPIGNEGIGLEPNYDAMIADDAVDLAAAVVHLYRDPDLLERLAAAGKTAASERFSRESARQALLAALHL
jgi:glycosyltransferase involved in cell wall biosynthesis